MILPFGRLMLWFAITSGLFKGFSGVKSIQSIEILCDIYTGIAGVSIALSSICLVLWILFTVISPGSLFQSGLSLKHISGWLDDLFCEIPHFRIGLLSLIIALVLSWIPFVTAIALTVFVLATVMWVGRILLFVYGSASY